MAFRESFRVINEVFVFWMWIVPSVMTKKPCFETYMKCFVVWVTFGGEINRLAKLWNHYDNSWFHLCVLLEICFSETAGGGAAAASWWNGPSEAPGGRGDADQSCTRAAAGESRRINNISIDVWFIMIGQYLKIWNLRVQKHLNIEKIIFKVVQMKFLAMHINNQTLSFDIFTVGNVQMSSWNMIFN